MDNPAAESNDTADTALNVNDAAEIFSRRFADPAAADGSGANGQQQDGQQTAQGQQTEDKQDGTQQGTKADDGQQQDDSTATDPNAPRFKVKVDGQEIEVTQDELLNGYSRQQDYTKKTMELADQRKQIEQSAAQVNAERQHYQNQLAQMAQALGQALHEQQNIDWQQLLENDPVEYLKQRHLFEQRQAAFGQAQAEQQRLTEQAQRNGAAQMQARFQEEQQALLAKLPEWKDEAKAKAEKEQVRKFLESSGYKPEEISQAVDHRAIVLARKAMLFDQLIAQQKEAAKKVEKLPPKVERPGVGNSSALDGRSSAMQRLSKTGKVEDAAAVFASLLG